MHLSHLTRQSGFLRLHRYIYEFLLPFFPEFHASLEDLKFLELAFVGKNFGVRSGLMTQEDLECYKYYFRKPGKVTLHYMYYFNHATNIILYYIYYFIMEVKLAYVATIYHIQLSNPIF